jgi:hypothetical protein
MNDLYAVFDKSLFRIVESGVAVSSDIDPDRVITGATIATLAQSIGSIASKKTEFTNEETGYILGVDEGTPKFYIGTDTSYLNFDGTTLTLSGSLSASTIIGSIIKTASSGERAELSPNPDVGEAHSMQFYNIAGNLGGELYYYDNGLGTGQDNQYLCLHAGQDSDGTLVFASRRILSAYSGGGDIGTTTDSFKDIYINGDLKDETGANYVTGVIDTALAGDVTIGGDLTVTGTISPSGYTINNIASNDLQWSNDTAKASNSLAFNYTTVKEVLLNEDLPFCRLKYDFQSSGGHDHARVKVYKNDIVIGNGYATLTSDSVSEDFSGWVAGDKIQIKGCVDNQLDNCNVSNMKFFFKSEVTAIGGRTLTTPLPIEPFEIEPTNQDP